MASKLETLRRYMGEDSGGASDRKEKKSNSKKKAKKSKQATCLTGTEEQGPSATTQSKGRSIKPRRAAINDVDAHLDASAVTAQSADEDEGESQSPQRDDESKQRKAEEEGNERNRMDQQSRKEEKANEDEDDDLSPPRRRGEEGEGHDDDLSPPRRPEQKEEEEDDDDLSPPRRGGGDGEGRSETGASKPRAGILSGKEFGQQVRRQREEEKRRVLADPERSGIGAETMVRDEQTGERISASEYERRQREEARRKRKEEERRQPEWSQGLAQKRWEEEERQQMAHEASRPFARREDDPDLEAERMAKQRWGDPMAKKAQSDASQRPDGTSQKLVRWLLPFY